MSEGTGSDLSLSLNQWETMVSEAPMVGSKIDIKKWAKIITGGGDEE